MWLPLTATLPLVSAPTAVRYHNMHPLAFCYIFSISERIKNKQRLKLYISAVVFRHLIVSAGLLILFNFYSQLT